MTDCEVLCYCNDKQEVSVRRPMAYATVSWNNKELIKKKVRSPFLFNCITPTMEFWGSHPYFIQQIKCCPNVTTESLLQNL